ncbi:PREDICTED: CCAAT/enhancer-binding protein zeta-like [Camelina sativa]|uniref:CCAAT/enhancer-binding protein zeta-like n=2 Tax=Camelina sativa TaxID=90675 RepID=A0ABM0TLH6_CAMSA|nr:PREDICTED: CCAAT/enhancer-binding protein zeta-like [Camelina sativa]
MSKTKPLSKSSQDLSLLTSDIASFASSIGLASSLPSSGFNDTDFRKPLKPKSKRIRKPKKDASADDKTKEDEQGGDTTTTRNPKSNTGNEKGKKPNKDAAAKQTIQPKPKPGFLSIEDDTTGDKAKRFNEFKGLPKLPLVKASLLSSEWYNDAAELEEKVFGGRSKVAVANKEDFNGVVEKKRELGERLMWQYAEDFVTSKGKGGDMKMVMSAQKSGTVADKITAFEIMVGENPIANMRSLDALLGMVTSKVGKRFAFRGLKALSEILIRLLPDRKLKTLLQRPLNSIPENKDGNSLLLFWYWEECLKQRYERFVNALDESSKDMLPELKDKALKTIFFMLTSKSEQERKLLVSLVNKLGDPQNKSASNADYHLTNLLADHPNMKAVVIDEVDSFLFRPHLGLRAKYHGVNFLSQIRLSHKGDDPKVAKRLIDVYFALFKVLTTEATRKQGADDKGVANKKNANPKDTKQETSSDSPVELDSRILSALLTGVNRAFPYVSTDEADDIIESQTPVLFKLVHSKNFNVGVQSLMLLDKISSKNKIVSDRFYRALYSKLLLPSAMNSSKAEMFIGLLLRAMKNDINVKRVAAFAKRILQVALQQPPQYACASLFLLSEVLKARPPLWKMVVQSESVEEEEDVEHFEDVIEGDDIVPINVAENEKSNVQVDHDGGEITGRDGDSSSDDEEALAVRQSDEEDNYASDDSEELFIKETPHELQKTMEVSNDMEKRSQPPKKSSCLPGGYDPRHREPSYCNADRASWWELVVLSKHAHPSVATMAGTLLSGTNIIYNGNPLIDLSLSAFLDKFMEKKAKQNTWHGGSQIEPSKKLDMSNRVIGAEILSLEEADVAPEDLVFHKFYVNKMNSTKQSKKKKKKKLPEEEAAEELYDVNDGDGGENYGSDVELDGGDESDNDEIENMLDDVDDNAVEEEGSEYDYDDLDKVAGDDEEELVADVSDAEIDSDMDMDMLDGEEDVEDDVDDSGDNDSDGDDGRGKKKKQEKRKRKSPFASLEEYEHLIDQDEKDDSKSKRKVASEPTKKKKKKKTKASE